MKKLTGNREDWTNWDNDRKVKMKESLTRGKNICKIKEKREISLGRHCVNKACVWGPLSFRDLEYLFSPFQHIASEFSNTQ